MCLSLMAMLLPSRLKLLQNQLTVFHLRVLLQAPEWAYLQYEVILGTSCGERLFAQFRAEKCRT